MAYFKLGQFYLEYGIYLPENPAFLVGGGGEEGCFLDGLSCWEIAVHWTMKMRSAHIGTSVSG
jgi:hypothetical protein